LDHQSLTRAPPMRQLSVLAISPRLEHKSFVFKLLRSKTSKYSVDDKNGVAAGTSAPQTIFTGMHFVRDTRVLPW
jgi:hypothetical protein